MTDKMKTASDVDAAIRDFLDKHDDAMGGAMIVAIPGADPSSFLSACAAYGQGIDRRTLWQAVLDVARVRLGELDNEAPAHAHAVRH